MAPPLVFLPGKFLRQSSLAGYSPWGCKDSDMTEHDTYSRDVDQGLWPLEQLLAVPSVNPSVAE